MGCDIHGFLEIRKYAPKVMDWIDLHSILDHRNYDVFAIFAGVRNYVNAPLISEPKGFPSDASVSSKVEFENMKGDAHTPSWLTYKEICDYFWSNSTKTFIDGRISVIDKVTGKEIEKFCEGTRDEEHYRYEQKVRTVSEIVPPIWRAFLDYMKELSSIYGGENVRIVFWFDN